MINQTNIKCGTDWPDTTLRQYRIFGAGCLEQCLNWLGIEPPSLSTDRMLYRVTPPLTHHPHLIVTKSDQWNRLTDFQSVKKCMKWRIEKVLPYLELITRTSTDKIHSNWISLYTTCFWFIETALGQISFDICQMREFKVNFNCLSGAVDMYIYKLLVLFVGLVSSFSGIKSMFFFGD